MISAIKDQAFEALKRLCQGILDGAVAPSKRPDLNEIHQNALILLYRVLFILYAESHQILPISNPEYFENYSLQKLRFGIQDKVIKPAPTTNLYWSRLKTLFKIISGSQENLNQIVGVPRFNGGLFSPEHHVFLERHDVGDCSLIEAIKDLSQNQEGELFDYASLAINQLGSIYEFLLEYRIRKNSGSFYTPPEIVDYMSNISLKPIFTHFRAGATTNNQLDVKKYSELILNLKILDPAMGSGHFLLGIAESIVKELMLAQGNSSTDSEQLDRYRYLQKIIAYTIYGVDLNAMAVELAEVALWLELAPQKEPPSLLDHRLKWANALIGMPLQNLSEQHNLAQSQKDSLEKVKNFFSETEINPFRWELEFPVVFQQENPGFDLIIGNPPYLNAISMRDQMPKVRDFLKENYKFLSEKWDIYIAFIEKGMQLLKNGGILSFIIPNTFLSEKYAKPIQEHMLKTCRILQIDYFPDISIFKNVGIRNIILTIQKEPPILPILKVFHRDLKGSVEIKEINEYEKIFTDFFNDSIKFDETKFYTLGDIAYISTGIVFNAKEPEFKGEFKKKDLISSKVTKVHSRKLLEGDNVFPYEIRGHRYVEWGSDRVPGKIRRPTFNELHQGNKLVTNKLGELKVAFDGEGLVCDQTVRVVMKWEQLHGVENLGISKALKKTCRERQDLESISQSFDYHFLLGLLNSKACRYLFYKLRTDQSMDINPDILRQIPIPRIKLTEQNPIIDIIHQLITNIQKIKKIRSDFSRDEIEPLLQHLDQQFYSLYGFTPEQIQIVENSNRL